MITEREQLAIAQTMATILEQRVAQAASDRFARLRECVDIKSPNQAYWYVGDSNGYIQILQDASYMCTGIHVIGQELSANNSNLKISIEDLWPPRQATQNGALPTSITDATSLVEGQSISIPLDHFLPAYTRGNTFSFTPRNVDYWYTPVAQWLIDRGDTLRCLFEDTATLPVPLVVLSGFKVLG